MIEITITGTTLEEIRDTVQDRIMFSAPSAEPDPTWALKQRIKLYVKFRTFINGGDCNANRASEAFADVESRFNAGAISECEGLLDLLLHGDFDSDCFRNQMLSGSVGNEFRRAYRGSSDK